MPLNADLYITGQTEITVDQTSSSPKVALVEGIRLLEDDMGSTFTWAGQTFRCAGGAEFGGKAIDEGGFRVFSKLRIKVRTELLNGNIPQEKQTLIYKGSPTATGKRYRIDSVSNYWDAVLQLDCNDPNQGA